MSDVGADAGCVSNTNIPMKWDDGGVTYPQAGCLEPATKQLTSVTGTQLAYCAKHYPEMQAIQQRMKQAHE